MPWVTEELWVNPESVDYVLSLEGGRSRVVFASGRTVELDVPVRDAVDKILPAGWQLGI